MSAILRRTAAGLIFVLGASLAQAADPVVTTTLGAGAGALVGQAVGGRDGAVIGGVLGAAGGAMISTRRPQVIVGGTHAMAPPPPMSPAPRMMQVDYYGPDVFYGPYPPPPRGPGQWRLLQDAWGNTYWQWEPAVVIVPPPVYTVPAYPPHVYPPPPVYGPPAYRPRAWDQTPRWHGNPPARWANPHRGEERVRAPVPPPAYRPAPPSYQPPAHRAPSAPPPARYQAPPGR